MRWLCWSLSSMLLFFWRQRRAALCTSPCPAMVLIKSQRKKQRNDAVIAHRLYPETQCAHLKKRTNGNIMQPSILGFPEEIKFLQKMPMNNKFLNKNNCPLAEIKGGGRRKKDGRKMWCGVRVTPISQCKKAGFAVRTARHVRNRVMR